MGNHPGTPLNYRAPNCQTATGGKLTYLNPPLVKWSFAVSVNAGKLGKSLGFLEDHGHVAHDTDGPIAP